MGVSVVQPMSGHLGEEFFQRGRDAGNIELHVVAQAAHRAMGDEAVRQAEAAYHEFAQFAMVGKQFQHSRVQLFFH